MVDYLCAGGRFAALRRRTPDGFLRSSIEIYFYERFKEMFPTEEISVDQLYPNSWMRYDFQVLGHKIEICPMYNGKNTKYTEKMNKKVALFGCTLLANTQQIDEFLNVLASKHRPNQ